MAKKCPVYTRTGDSGTTSLASGERVSKNCTKLEAYGTVDELNSHLGLLLTYVDTPEDRSQLLRNHHLLFAVGASLEQTDTYDENVSYNPLKIGDL